MSARPGSEELAQSGDVPDVPDLGAGVVAVIVVTYNSEALLSDLFASLPAGLCGLNWSLIVVDNDSGDETVATARRLAPEALVVETGHNGGYAAGINAGIAAAPEHCAVLVLNPDVRLHRGCVPELLRWLCRGDVGIVAPQLFDGAGTRIDSQRREPSLSRAVGDAVLGARRAGRWSPFGEVVTEPTAYERATIVDWVEGSTMLISSACLGACGRWDEGFFLYSEETEFALRARDLGFDTMYVPSATAVHLEGGSAGSTMLWPLLVANRIRLYSMRHGRWSTALFWAFTVVREASRVVVGQPASRAALAVLLSPKRMAAPRGPGWIDRSATTVEQTGTTRQRWRLRNPVMTGLTRKRAD